MKAFLKKALEYFKANLIANILAVSTIVVLIFASAFVAFCFGYFLIGRLESLNLLQVNLSDINTYLLMLFSSR